MDRSRLNVYPLKVLLEQAEQGAYAVGSFSPRYPRLIEPVLRAGIAMRSPMIVQASQIEFERVEMSIPEFAESFWRFVSDLQPDVPVALHLDHTFEIRVIVEAIENGFTSVMIDASKKELEDNIATTREVVAYAHARGVSVEAELGRIFSSTDMETESDVELYTDPVEAERFVRETGVDALAVSVGTAHGVYMVRKPKVDLARLQAIRARTPVHLVLHGGSGVPEHMIKDAIRLPGGGVSKVNIATDLEQAFLGALGFETRMKNAAIADISAQDLARGLQAVQAVVEDKMVNFLASNQKA
jgi:ketose-bisphosphate aldolase